MKLEINRIILSVLLGYLITLNAIAQKSLQELSTLDDKKFEKCIVFERAGYGYLKTWLKQEQLTIDQLPQINDVALLTFILFDGAIQSRADQYNIEKDGIYNYITEEGGKKIVSSLYNISLPGIKLGLENKKILLPEQYLDTEDKRKLYENAEIKPTGLIGFVNQIMGNNNELAANTVPDGYSFHFATFAATDVKLSRSVGDLANKLGVESFLSTQITFILEKKKIYITDIKMALHIPNPAPYNPEIKYFGVGPTKGYWEGICLASMTFTPKSKIEVAQTKGQHLIAENYTGLDKIFERLTKKMMAHINEEIEKLKK